MVALRMKGYPPIVMCLRKYELVVPKDACETADKRVIRIGLTICAWARQVKNATLGEKIAVEEAALEVKW